MAIVEPKYLPSTTGGDKKNRPNMSDADWQKYYNEFTPATYAITSNQALYDLVADDLSNYFVILGRTWETRKSLEASVSEIQNITVPAINAAINTIANSGKADLVKQAADLRNKIQAVINGQKDSSGKLINGLALDLKNIQYYNDSINNWMTAVSVCVQNMLEADPIHKSTVKDASYWCRIIHLWGWDLAACENNFNTWVDKTKADIETINTSVSAILDIDDAVNGNNSYRNKNKKVVAQAEVQETEQQKLIKSSAAFYSSLEDKQKNKPLGTYINKALKFLFNNGSYYFTDVPPKTFTKSDTPPQRSAKKFIRAVAEGKYDDLDSVTIETITSPGIGGGGTITIPSDVDLLVENSGSSVTKSEVINEINRLKGGGRSTGTVDANIDADASRQRSRANSGLTTTSNNAEDAAKAAADQKAAYEKQLEDQKAKYEAQQKALSDANAEQQKVLAEQMATMKADIEKTKKEFADSIAKEKEAAQKAAEKKAQDEKLAKDLESDYPGSLGPVIPDQLPKKMPSFFESKIMGIPAPYAIGGAVAVVGLILLTRKK